MQNQGPKWWLVGLIVLATIYLTILALVGVALLFTINVTALPFLIVGLSVLLVGCTVYLAFRKKQTVYLSISLTMAGVIFILLGAIVFVPYTTHQTYATGASFDYTHWLGSASGDTEPLIDQNGTLVEKTLAPMSSKTYFYEGHPLPYNFSFFQIEFSGSGELNFVMVSRTYDYGYGTVFFNETSLWTQTAGTHWRTRLWTPPTDYLYRVDFIFTNLENQTISFYFRMTEFYNEENVDASNTNYRSVLDPSLAYAGLSMICVAAVISAYLNKRPRTTEKTIAPGHSFKQ